MNRLNSFLIGVVVGAVGLYCATTYHIVQANDGLHMVPKISSGLGDAYVDIREFDAAQWNEHKNVAVALVNADKEELLGESGVWDLRQTAHNALESLGLR